MAGEADVFVLLFLALICPPAAVAFVAGCGADLCLNILLTLLGYLPGCIHAFWLVLRRAEANERYGYKNWTYIGMGDYAPIDAGPPSSGQHSAPSYGQVQTPPPPPPGQYPAGKAPPPASQAPVQAGYGYAPQAPVDQQWGGYAPSPAPADQKQGGYQAQAPADQKAVNVSSSAPTDQKSADPTAPPSGT
ncbi:hypothetical protein J3R83DRAFT_9489 [Lanmaoa asiatica]|nr:hypothetical protein J3R83DRAFT_9489 [Lanmaoa asiatica]